MSMVVAANVAFESTANTRIQYNGSNTFSLVAAGANVAVINSAGISVGNTTINTKISGNLITFSDSTTLSSGNSVIRTDIVQTTNIAQQQIARTNELSAAVEAGSYLGFCVNPFMEISQENGQTSGAYTNSGRYAADQFYSTCSLTTATATVQNISDPFSGTTNFRRFRNAIRITVGTSGAMANGDFFGGVVHHIEGNYWKGFGWGTADAASVDIVAVVSASVTGTYSIALRNSGAYTRCYVTPISLVANTPTVVFVTIPGETTGVWTTDNTSSVQIWVCLGAGSTYQSAVNNSWQAASSISVLGGGTNLAATASATFTVAYMNVFPTGVLPYTSASQVDLTHLANMRRPYDDELRRCQRYFFAAPTSGGAAYNSGGYSAASTANILTYFYPVVMRTTPSGAIPTATVSNTGTPIFTIRNTSSYEVSTTTTATGGWQYYYLSGTINFNARM